MIPRIVTKQFINEKKLRNYAENNFNPSIKFGISTIFTQFKLEREKITLQKQSLILYRINLVKFISIPLQIFFFHSEGKWISRSA